MTSACFSRGHTGFSRNATLVATVNPPALAGGVFNERESWQVAAIQKAVQEADAGDFATSDEVAAMDAKWSYRAD